jgi:phytoene dehydrogenase-like protein
MGSETEVIIVGGGVAGLCCALKLEESGVPYLLLEASDAVGGRVRTDSVDGFRLDRGFQVLLTAYPEVLRVVNIEMLELGCFYPGALVACDGGLHRVADPWRHPLDALRSAASPVGTLADKLRVWHLRRRARAGSLDDLFGRPEQPTISALKADGFSDVMIERFFRPFLGGIFLDKELVTSSRMLEFVFRMFSLGDTALPAGGMQAIPDQIASRLSVGSIRLGERVMGTGPGRVELEGGETIVGRAAVLAVEGRGV